MVTPSLTWPLLTVTAGAAWMKMDYSLEPITPTNLSSSSPERREADAGRERDRRTERETETEISGLWRWWWRKEITESSSVRIRPHLSPPPHIHSPLADVHSQTPEGKRSARGHGVPPRGKALLNPSVHTHTIPILIPHAPLTSLLKHRSKSPDWSQRLRNKWRQIPDFCMAFFCREAWEGCSCIPLVQIYSDIGNVVPNSPHDFWV